ncbi:MAG: vanadium-dependent haloperoxidase [Rhodospirillales bacterium]|nr:vanadium-dependent haloperoxidase [Rhodospirillales bacterium]
MRLRAFVAGVCLIAALLCGGAQAGPLSQEVILQQWYQLVLKLVRHTPTYTPPLASRNFAYLGVTSYEAVASGDDSLVSLAGQLNGLEALPRRIKGKVYDESIVLNSALAKSMQFYFGNTGPSGQNALRSRLKQLEGEASKGAAKDVAKRSKAFGEAIAQHIFAWSETDGGATIENMGFPVAYELKEGPGQWEPTNQLGMQQSPLLPEWGKNRPFAMPMNMACKLPPPAYSEAKDSAFFQQALEVQTVRNKLTPEQAAIARYWSDDPMLTVTPPGHWISITLQIAERDKLTAARTSEGLARVGIAVADAFIGCWRDKYDYNLVRPVSFIRKHLEPNWDPLLITPPFPEYPSGHSVQSAAAATVLEKMFGASFAFEDAKFLADGAPPRRFASFKAAAEEAAMSRLYGGIHFRAAIERGLEQGECIGSFAANLKTVAE